MVKKKKEKKTEKDTIIQKYVHKKKKREKDTIIQKDIMHSKRNKNKFLKKKKNTFFISQIIDILFNLF